ncbi:MAG: hypothetical protein M0Z75_11450 [Nitrospiraceae bacterium]|nr:hypothetical protein [Nitrospiraceae bacterium]
MPDNIIELIKKQGEKRVADIRELTGKLSEQLKHLISLIPEETRNKSLETFLNDIRKGVLGERTPRQGVKRGRKPAAAKRGRKAVPGVKPAAKRGRRKKETDKEKKQKTSQAVESGQKTA